MAIKGARAEDGRVTAHLLVRGGRTAIDFYTRAFGAAVLYESAMPDGNGVHGLNERIRVKVLYDSRDYLYRLMKLYGDQAG